MPEYEQVLKAKEAAEERLRGLPGVHAVGVSKKVVAGKPTDELCITVFLVEKKPLDRLAPEEVVPPEIDGVKTDVVALERPRLLAADLSRLVATVSANQQSVTFTGADQPGSGFGIVLLYTIVTAAGSGPALAFLETGSWMGLSDIARAVAGAVNGSNSQALTASATGAQVTLTPLPGNACTISRCLVIATDNRRYFEDYLRGGIQIQIGDSNLFGTLGCLATTAPTPQAPHGRVVALTCQHVVAPFSVQPTNLVAATAPGGGQITFSVADARPIRLDSLVLVRLMASDQFAFYTTIAGETPLGVAGSVAAALNQLGIAGVHATATAAASGTATVTLVGDTVLNCQVFGPPTTTGDPDLSATVTGLAIDFSGEVGGGEYAIFTHVNAGGIHATFGVYTHPEKGATLSSIAQAIAQAINNLPVRGSVTAAASAARVTVSNAQEVGCIVRSDFQVGQPDNDFGSPCFHCCSHRIGRVLDSRIDLDTALVQIDSGKKYKPEIEGLGLLTGTYVLRSSDVNVLPLLKHGRTSGETWGTVTAMNMGGQIGEGAGFSRRYTDAFMVTTSSPTSDPFSLPGDSGSALCNLGGEVVGIVFGGGTTTAWVTPIEQITAAFSALSLDFAPDPEPGHSPDDVRTVPAAAMAAIAALAPDRLPDGRPAGLAAPLGHRLAQVEEDLAATPAGSEVAGAVRLHLAEAQRLVRTNRRAAAVWRRQGGPRLLEAVLAVVQRRDRRLPEEVDGRPFAECLERLARGLARYASPAFAADLSRFAPRLAGLAGLSYPQMLAAFADGGAG